MENEIEERKDTKDGKKETEYPNLLKNTLYEVGTKLRFKKRNIFVAKGDNDCGEFNSECIFKHDERNCLLHTCYLKNKDGDTEKQIQYVEMEQGNE